VDAKPAVVEEPKVEPPEAEPPKAEPPEAAPAPVVGEKISPEANEKVADTADEPFQDKKYREFTEMGATFPVIAGKFPRRKSSENVTFDAYAASHEAGFASLLAMEKPDGWNFKCEAEEVKVYTKSVAGSPLLYFKGVSDFSLVSTNIVGLAKVILSSEDRPKWDEACQYGETPQFTPPFYKYTYFQIKPKGAIVSARDCYTLGRLLFEQDGAVDIAGKSVESPDCPEKPGFVRMNFVAGGYILRPKPGDPSVVTVTWTGCADPKGWLPTFLVNAVVGKQALTLAKIKEYMKTLPMKTVPMEPGLAPEVLGG
jgi:hypothetical protein